VSLRAVLLYFFGAALIFLTIALVSGYTHQALQGDGSGDGPALGKEARTAVEEEQDLGALRSRALFYLDVARGIRRARVEDTDQIFYSVRLLAGIVSGLFFIGGIAVLLLPGISLRAGGAPKP
jgi:hypothetical protein